jgi:hypothetical protein
MHLNLRAQRSAEPEHSASVFDLPLCRFLLAMRNKHRLFYTADILTTQNSQNCNAHPPIIKVVADNIYLPFFTRDGGHGAHKIQNSMLHTLHCYTAKVIDHACAVHEHYTYIGRFKKENRSVCIGILRRTLFLIFLQFLHFLEQKSLTFMNRL